MKLERAKGTRDFFPEDKIIRQDVIEVLREEFETYGFVPIETPILEKFETLSSKYSGGEEILKETFKLKDQGDRTLGLRYDLTVPMSRFVGMNPQLKFPFKRYQIGRVFRDGPIKLGRYREFWQCDIDTIGCKNLIAEAEILACVEAVFKKLDLNIKIELNSRKILDGILDLVNIKESKRTTVILSIDKLKKIGVEDVKKELKQKDIDKEKIDQIISLVSKDFQDLKKSLTNEAGKQGIQEIEELLNYCDKFKLESVKFLPSLARGLAYYTGPVFEVYLKNSKIESAIAAGGRYDSMIGQFLGKNQEIPATGIAFGLDVITDAIKKDKKRTNTQVYVIPIKTLEKSLPIIKKLRDSRIKTDFDINNRGISKNLDYANKLKIPYVIFIGEKELSKNKVKLRNMETGTESFLSVQDLIKKVGGASNATKS